MTEQDEIDMAVIAAAGRQGFHAIRVDCLVRIDSLPDTQAALVHDSIDAPRLVFVSTDDMPEQAMLEALDEQAFGGGPRAIETAALLWKKRKSEIDHEQSMRIFGEMRALAADNG